MLNFTELTKAALDIGLIVAGIALLVPVFFLIFSYLLRLSQYLRIRSSSSKLVFFEVQVPAANETRIVDADQMFAGLAGMDGILTIGDKLLGSDSFVSFEIVAEHELIKFIIACPEHIGELVARHINGVYPSAEVHKIEGYDIFSVPGKFYKKRLVLTNRHPYIPLLTYEHLSADTISAFLENVSQIAPGDATSLQIVIHPISESWRISGKKYVAELNYKKFEKENPSNNDRYKIGDEVISGIQKKIEKVGFGVEMKLIARSSSGTTAGQNFAEALSSFSQFSNPGQNSFKVLRGWAGITLCNLSDTLASLIALGGKPWYGYIWEYRRRYPKYTMILNSAELASIFHFPNKNIKAPHIDWLTAVKGATSNLLVTEPGDQYMWLGQSVFRGNRQDIFIKPADRMRHMYVIGQTGTGKSKFIAGACLRDIKMGHGVAFIDPHGSDTEWILERIPKERQKDVVVIDPSDLERPIGMNMMEFTRPEQRTLIINDMLTIFDKLYDLKQTGGPIFEQYMRNAMMLVMSHPESGNTLLEIPRVLTDEKFRDLKLSHCDLPEVVRFWREEAVKVEGEASLANLVPYITSKLSTFLYNDFIRPMVTQQKSTVDFRAAMDGQKILLIKLSKGLVGHLNSNFLGMIIIGKLLMAALSREDLPEKERVPFFLYIDEFQNFLTDSVYSILSEARKYQLSLTIAHQFVNQLIVGTDTKIRDAVFGNIGTRVYMRVGVDDAGFLEKDVQPDYKATDLQNQSNGWAYVKMLVDGTYPPPFTMNTWFGKSKYDMVTDANPPEMTQELLNFSRQTYGRDIKEIEADIIKRGGSAADINKEAKLAATSGIDFNPDPQKNADLLAAFGIGQTKKPSEAQPAPANNTEKAGSPNDALAKSFGL